MFAFSSAFDSMVLCDGGLPVRSLSRSRWSLSLLLEDTVVSALPLAPVDRLREWPLNWPFWVWGMVDSCVVMSDGRGGSAGGAWCKDNPCSWSGPPE